MQDLDRIVRQRTAELQAANQKLQKEIAERRQMEEALRVSQERFSKAFQASPIPMAIQTLREDRFVDVNEAFLAYSLGKISLHAKIKVRLTEYDKITNSIKDAPVKLPANKMAETTVGRCMLNDVLPKGMPFYNFLISQKGCAKIIADCHVLLGRSKTITLLDNLKELGFKQATRAGVSIAVSDLVIPPNKWKIVDAAQRVVDQIEKGYSQGAITETERYNQLIDVWIHAREARSDQLDRSIGASAVVGPPPEREEVRELFGGSRVLRMGGCAENQRCKYEKDCPSHDRRS
jgi:hypothetical protein